MTHQTVEAETLPEIDFSELDDQHFKTYMSKSMKAAIRKYARREGLTDSEAGRELFKIAFMDPTVFGGFKPVNGAAKQGP